MDAALGESLPGFQQHPDPSVGNVVLPPAVLPILLKTGAFCD